MVLALPRVGKCDSSGSLSLAPTPCYVPTEVTFNFPATTTVNVTNISTLSNNATAYSYGGNPTSFTWQANQVDVQTFSLLIDYENATATNETRTVIISVFSGDLVPSVTTYSSSENEFLVNVRLSLSMEPTMPSATEIAQEGFSLVENRFVDMFNQLTVQNQEIADLNTKTTILAGVGMAFATVATFFALVAYKRKK